MPETKKSKTNVPAAFPIFFTVPPDWKGRQKERTLPSAHTRRFWHKKGRNGEERAQVSEAPPPLPAWEPPAFAPFSETIKSLEVRSTRGKVTLHGPGSKDSFWDCVVRSSRITGEVGKKMESFLGCSLIRAHR